MQKIRKFQWTVSEKMSKMPNFWNLIPLNPQIKIFFKFWLCWVNPGSNINILKRDLQENIEIKYEQAGKKAPTVAPFCKPPIET